MGSSLSDATSQALIHSDSSTSPDLHVSSPKCAPGTWLESSASNRIDDGANPGSAWSAGSLYKEMEKHMNDCPNCGTIRDDVDR